MCVSVRFCTLLISNTLFELFGTTSYVNIQDSDDDIGSDGRPRKGAADQPMTFVSASEGADGKKKKSDKVLYGEYSDDDDDDEGGSRRGKAAAMYEDESEEDDFERPSLGVTGGLGFNSRVQNGSRPSSSSSFGERKKQEAQPFQNVVADPFKKDKARDFGKKAQLVASTADSNKPISVPARKVLCCDAFFFLHVLSVCLCSKST